MKDRERLTMAFPGGELQEDVLRAMSANGIEYTRQNKKLKIEVTNMPVDLVVVRASSVPKLTTDPKSRIQGGMTGSDILWESGMDASTGEAIVIPSPVTPSSIFIGATEEFIEEVEATYQREVKVSDLEGRMVVTKFPRIASDLFTERSVTVKLFPEAGKTEAMQYAYDCPGIVDVINTGLTVKANKMRVINKAHTVSTRIFEAPVGKATRVQTEIFDAFRNMLTRCNQ